MSKHSISEFTRAEYLAFVDAIGRAAAPTEAENDRWIAHWDSVNPHPEKNGLMYWPSDGQSRTSEQITDEIERHCLKNGLPAFRDSAPSRIGLRDREAV